MRGRRLALISGEVMTFIKEWGKLVALVAAVVGLFKAIYEIQESRKQRAEELRWKRANAARELLDDIHHHELSASAVHMMDWCDGEADYQIVAGGARETISYSEVLEALKKNGKEARKPKEIYIRDCFDWFFYRIDRIEHYIRRGLIDFEDVKAVFRVYAQVTAKHRPVYDNFLAFHEYELAREFFRRYSD
jgi:hypothetical protein